MGDALSHKTNPQAIESAGQPADKPYAPQRHRDTEKNLVFDRVAPTIIRNATHRGIVQGKPVFRLKNVTKICSVLPYLRGE